MEELAASMPLAGRRKIRGFARAAAARAAACVSRAVGAAWFNLTLLPSCHIISRSRKAIHGLPTGCHPRHQQGNPVVLIC
jgi:hypothetical protein